MSLLKSVNAVTDVAEEKDIIGGGGALESGMYLATIDVAYLDKAASGAIGMTVKATMEGGRNYRETFWIQSGDAKGNATTYQDKKTGEMRHLPGFTMGNSIARLGAGGELTELNSEEKLVGIYNYDAQKEVPTAVEVITDLTGKQVYLGIVKQTVFKQAKQDNGSYANTAETRDENIVDKVFHPESRLTVAEILAGATEFSFFSTWKAKNEGQTRDRTGGAVSQPTSAAGASAQATAKPQKSIFG